jgi:hypothetical protein
VSTIFLIESIVALVLCVNAVRPLSAGGALSFASMMASWLCMELAPQSLVIQAGFTVGFSLSGGLDGTIGGIAVALSLVSMACLAYLIFVSMRSKQVVEDAFDVFPSIRSAHVTRATERFADHVYSLYREPAGSVLQQADTS